MVWEPLLLPGLTEKRKILVIYNGKEYINDTMLHPDMVILEMTKQVIIWKLTMPIEEHLEEADDYRLTKYHELIEQCRS